MAVCSACRATLERLEGTDTWVREGTVAPDGMAGEVYCSPAPEQIHTPARMGLLEWVADDTELCVFCAWPESSTVVLRIGLALTVCQEHIWRGLLAKLGPHPRGGESEGIYPEGQE